MCVYNKKNMCIYVCVWGCLDKYISVVTWPPQTKIPGSAPDSYALGVLATTYSNTNTSTLFFMTL